MKKEHVIKKSSNMTEFKKGVFYASMGSLWWGLLGTIFFKYISTMGPIEVTIHRLIWTCVILFL